MQREAGRAAMRFFSCVLVGLVAAGPGTSEAQEPAGRPGRTSRQTPEVDFDLAKTPAGGLTKVAVPRGQVRLLISNRVPSATYRIRLGHLDTTAQGQGEYDRLVIPGGLPGARLNGADPAQFRFVESQPGCAAWSEALQAFLREGDEVAVPARIARLDAAVGDSGCPTARQMGGITTLAAGSYGPVTTAVGGRAFLTVERLDGSGAVVKGWEVELEGPTREEGWSRGSESEWLVAEVLSDVARLVEFAKRGALGNGTLDLRSQDSADGVARFTVRWSSRAWRPAEAEVAIRSHIWAPQTYAGVVAAWLSEAGLRPRPARELPKLVSRMTDLSPETLVAESTRLSGQLADAPLDPGVHEQVAFLLGVSAWREQAGWYQDLRPALCGMTAHLALASALRGKGGSPIPEGMLAGAMIEILAERMEPARAVLEDLGKKLSQPAERSWLQALALRVRAATVPLEAPSDGSLLMQVEFARRLRAESGETALLDFIEGRDHEPASAWTRVLLAGVAGGVEAGNAYSRMGVGLELAEARKVLGVASDEPQAIVTAIRQALDNPGGRLGPGPRPVVASRAFWAAGAERQLLEMANAHLRHVRRVLGLDDEGRALARQYGQWLGSLWLYPVIALHLAEEGQEAEPCDLVQQRLLASRPELVTAAHWIRSVMGRCSALMGEGRLTLPAAWFVPPLPPGTAFDNESRLPEPNLGERLAPESVERLRSLAPRSLAVIEARARRVEGRGTTSADIREAWGSSTDDDRRALLALLALGPDDAERLRLLAKLCDLEAEQCLVYGNELARSDPASAAVVLERGLATARDRVHVSNTTYWLADYYLEQGREADALRVAALSADSYSDLGLRTQARVFERLRRLEEAEAFYRRVQERYPTDRALDCFYVRQAHRSPEGPYAQRGREAREALFPKGLEAKPTSALSVIPRPRRNQVFVLDAQPLGRDYELLGVRSVEIVRAVYGYEVWNDEQYTCARTLQDSDELQLVVQRGEKLVELRGPFQRVRYGPVAPTK